MRGLDLQARLNLQLRLRHATYTVLMQSSGGHETLLRYRLHILRRSQIRINF